MQNNVINKQTKLFNVNVFSTKILRHKDTAFKSVTGDATVICTRSFEPS